MQLDAKEVEEVAKALYIRSLKLLPPDIKRGFERLMANETDATGRAADGTIGLLAGILGGLGGYNGVLPAIWTQLRGWPKQTARAVYQPFILATHVAILTCLGIVALDWRGVVLLGVALPPLFAGVWVGWKIYGRLNERRFQQVLAVLLMVSGVTLVWF